MLIKLYALPSLETACKPLVAQNIEVRRAMAYERRQVVDWIGATFNAFWSDEATVAFGRNPIGCWIGLADQALIGFCCVDTTYRNFVGPVGVGPLHRGRGLGRALLLAALGQLRAQGYAYAVAGDVGEAKFFEKTAGAVRIAGSTPGAYPAKIHRLGEMGDKLP